MIRTVLFVCILGTSVAGFAQMTMEEAMQQARQYQQQTQATKAVILSESDIRNFLAVRDDLEKLGPTTNVVEAAGANAQALGILARHGFTLDSFGNVAKSIGLAIGSLDSHGVDPAREQQNVAALARMKEQLSPAQYEMMRSQLEASKAMVADLENQPAGNVELVKKYRDQIEKRTP